ncbi:MAG: DNA cytosine methyltransferase [Chloroflexota bacterium]|nr:DNA cytosine methyltransferase [Chloroflexota bacterium]
MLAVDLCAGAGGLSKGLVAAGVDIAVAVESDRHCAATYRHNFPSVNLIEDDIRSVSGRQLLRMLNLRKGELGALVAGLPCQGFSESNRRTRVASNPRNQLYRQVLAFLEVVRPRWFLLENVAGITTLESGGFLARMVEDFRQIGYRTRHQVLNARDFAVAQFRRRTFIVGHCTEKQFTFPTPEGTCRVTVRDAIEDLPLLQNGATTDTLSYRSKWKEASDYARTLRNESAHSVSGNQVSRNTKRVLERYEYIGMGQNWRAIPRRLMDNYRNLEDCHTGIYYRLEWDARSKVIGNFRKNMLIHPSQNRGLSIREAARLQSFPDEHEFVGPLNDRQQQVGDAVPPNLARAVGAAMRKSDSA